LKKTPNQHRTGPAAAGSSDAEPPRASGGPTPDPPRPSKPFLAIAAFLLLAWMGFLAALALTAHK
jgi:hypothetical protein